MNIRPVQPSDAEEWLRLRLALWPDLPPHEILAEVEHFFTVPFHSKLPPRQAIFVCEHPGGGLCGLIEVSIRFSVPGCNTRSIGYIEAWYVDPAWRGQGLGRTLVKVAEDWARGKGCREMASDTTPAYPDSPAAHAALGYEEVERYFRKELGS
jgi:aminoglycoside 6'-N-acetyltransferase I